MTKDDANNIKGFFAVGQTGTLVDYCTHHGLSVDRLWKFIRKSGQLKISFDKHKVSASGLSRLESEIIDDEVDQLFSQEEKRRIRKNELLKQRRAKDPSKDVKNEARRAQYANAKDVSNEARRAQYADIKDDRNEARRAQRFELEANNPDKARANKKRNAEDVAAHRKRQSSEKVQRDREQDAKRKSSQRSKMTDEEVAAHRSRDKSQKQLLRLRQKRKIDELVNSSFANATG
ncbi:hypothetical protein THAOC_09341, partial [Thalassiosira oceanica]